MCLFSRIVCSRSYFLAMATVALLWSGLAISCGHAALIKSYGNDSPTSFGGYTVSRFGLDQYYVIGIEVPPGASRLVVDIFDADVGAGGAADISGDRDNQNGGAWDSFYIYTLYDEQLNFIPVANYNYYYGDATTPAGSDNAWTTFYSTPNPTPGHWLMVVYPYPSAAVGGAGASDDLNAFKVRAHDGDPGPGGQEFNTYMISPIPIGTNGIPGPVQSSARHTVYPYVTSGCELNTHDFDSDVPNLPAGTPPLETQIHLVNRTGAFSYTVTQATMSGQDVWVNNTIGPSAGVEPSGTDFLRDGMGIWESLLVANEQGTGGTVAGANYNEVIIANFNNPTPVPGNAIEADTFRWYLPTDAGQAPVKTYVTQRVNFWSGPNPPVVGQTTEVEVEISVVNPTADPVTFSQGNNDLVQSTIPAVPELAFVGGSVTVTQGTAPGTAGLALPPAGGNGLLQWDPGVLAPGSSATLTYRIAVTPSAAGQRIAVTGTPLNGGTTADFVDHTGNINSPFANYSFGPLCELAVTESRTVPTPVYLSYVLLDGQPGHYRLRWRTAFEAGNIGFRVYREPIDDAAHLLGELPVSKTSSIAGAEYELALPVARLQQVWLMDIALDGRKTWHGPYRLNRAFGMATSQARERKAMPAEALENQQQRQQAHRQQQQQATTPVLDLITDHPGVYRVSFDRLRSQGYDFTGLPSNTLQLVNDGTVVPVVYNNDHNGIIAPGDYFEFVATARKSLYSTENAYRLQPGSALLGKTLASQPGSALPAGASAFMGNMAVLFEEDRQYSFSSPDKQNDPWYWRSYLVRSEPLADSVSFNLSRVDASASYGLKLNLWTMTDWPDIVNDHHVRLRVNGVAVADLFADGLGNQQLIARIPDGVLHNGQNSLELSFPADTGAAYELNYLDGFTITGPAAVASQSPFTDGPLHLPQALAADAQPLVNDVIFRQAFDAAATTVCHFGPCRQLSIASATPVLAYQYDGDSLLKIEGLNTGNTAQLTLRPQSLAGTWLVAEGAQSLPQVRPAATGSIQLPADTSFLVIAHPLFSEQLDQWVSAKQARGEVVSIVTTEAIYHHYSNGIRDAQAIRQFIADSAADRPIRHVLLVGADHYDYTDNLGSGQIPLVPGLYAPTGPYVRYAPVDALYGDVDADGLPDIPVGRWPVHGSDELSALVNKTLAFEARRESSQQVDALALVDANDGPTDFLQLLQSQVPVLPASWQQAVIDGNLPDAAALFRQSLARSPAYVEYLGHSSASQWSAKGLLTSSEAATLPNDGLALVMQWGCWNNYAVSPLYVSLAENLLQALDSGAVLSLGATAITDAKHELPVRKTLMQQLAKGETVGQALLAGKRALLKASGKNPQALQDALAGITILGDPSLRIVQ